MILKLSFRFRLVYLSIGLLITALYSISTRAATPLEIFLCIPGQQGAAISDRFKSCIPVQTYNQEFGNQNNLCKFEVTKEFGPVSAYLAIQTILKNDIPDSEIHFFGRDPFGTEFPITILKLKFSGFYIKRVGRVAESYNEENNKILENIVFRSGTNSSMIMTYTRTGGDGVKRTKTENIDCH